MTHGIGRREGACYGTRHAKPRYLDSHEAYPDITSIAIASLHIPQSGYAMRLSPHTR
jgi:hypothetical protein